jgi:hypothetical protein
MILLMFGWNLTLIGIVTLLLCLMMGNCGSFLIFGVGAFATGLLISIKLRKICSASKSDTVEEAKEEPPLDYY